MLRRRAERVSIVSSSTERTGGDNGASGGGGDGALCVIDMARLRGVDRVRIWSVVIACGCKSEIVGIWSAVIARGSKSGLEM